MRASMFEGFADRLALGALASGLAIAAACSGSISSDDDAQPAGGQLPPASPNAPGAVASSNPAGGPAGAGAATDPAAQPRGPGVSGASGAARYSELPDGKAGFNLEQVWYPDTFDRAASRAAFERSVYPLLRANCVGCHSSESHAQAPMHSDGDPALAHEYALTRVNFQHPEDSKLVVRMTVDRHNCFGRCASAGAQMLAAVEAWAAAVRPALPVVPRTVPEGVTVSEEEVRQWIADDRSKLAAGDAEFAVYTSLHELHNAGVSADRLNVARAALSKALNSSARWAPAVVNPVDINGQGMVYRFDTRHYWGHNKGVKALIFGGSDDDIFFGDKTDLLRHRFNYAAAVAQDPQFARMVWTRVQEGSKDAYQQAGAAANIKGFKGDYVELSQLVYTLSRADVYNAIMAIPVYAPELEKELGVVKANDIASYQYMVIEQAITIDSRLVFRAKTNSGGFYWKTFDIFAGSQQVFPFWEHPIPKYVSAAGATGRDLSLVASLLQPVGTEPSAGCNPSGSGQFTLCTNYTGEGGVQQSASEIIWNLPNGLQGYAIYGGLNQRRIDAFSFIVHDPRRLRSASDAAINGAGFTQDLRLTVGGSCMGCHSDGMNRAGNDLRDRLDNGAMTAAWTADGTIANQVRELYPPSSVVRPMIENDRKPFFDAMAQIRGGMIVGPDKNLHVEPIVWAFEWAQSHYGYANTTSN